MAEDIKMESDETSSELYNMLFFNIMNKHLKTFVSHAL